MLIDLSRRRRSLSSRGRESGTSDENEAAGRGRAAGASAGLLGRFICRCSRMPAQAAPAWPIARRTIRAPTRGLRQRGGDVRPRPPLLLGFARCARARVATFGQGVCGVEDERGGSSRRSPARSDGERQRQPLDLNDARRSGAGGWSGATRAAQRPLRWRRRVYIPGPIASRGWWSGLKRTARDQSSMVCAPKIACQ